QAATAHLVINLDVRRVEVQIARSDGTVTVVVDKAPVLDYGDRLAPGVEFPVEIEVPCDILRWELDDSDRRSAVVVLRYGLEDQAGRSPVARMGYKSVKLPSSAKATTAARKRSRKSCRSWPTTVLP